ncbi:MAG: hypothetical protein D6696_14190 [Acidobacteria bacterium]|nr:MAG: hypothetical protein D6696_14190 [Acidobacteriota bacterium]
MSIRDLTTTVVIPEADIADVYGVSPLPEIFRNPRTEHLKTTVCLQMVVNNPSWAASFLLLLLLLLLAAAIAAVTYLRMPRFREAALDDNSLGRVRLNRLTRQTLRDEGEKAFARARLAWWGNEERVAGVPPFQVLGGPRRWRVRRLDDPDNERILTLEPRRPRRKRSEEADDGF